MKISELVQQLQAIKDKHGDIEVRTQTLSHHWPPELLIVFKREEGVISGIDVAQYVLLNG